MTQFRKGFVVDIPSNGPDTQPFYATIEFQDSLEIDEVELFIQKYREAIANLYRCDIKYVKTEKEFFGTDARRAN